METLDIFRGEPKKQNNNFIWLLGKWTIYVLAYI